MKRAEFIALLLMLSVTQPSCTGPSGSQTLGSGGGTTSPASPTVVARWHFENDWVDGVGGNDGTAVSGTAPTFTTDKVSGTYAADLSAANARVDVGTSATLTPVDLTVTFWIKRTAASSGANMILWTKPCQWDHADGFYIGREGVGKALTLVVSGGNFVGVNADPDVVFALNAWTHVAVTFDSTTHVAHIYLNGVDQPLTNFGTPQEILPATGTSKFIGACAAGSSIAWPLDDLTVISGAMSAAEVQAAYLSEKAAAGL